jgi:two-component system sensor kinase FixL
LSKLQDILQIPETYQDFFDQAHDLIHFARPDGGLIYVNNSWMRLLGYSLEEIENKSIYSLVSVEDSRRFKKYREDIIKTGVSDQEILIKLVSKRNTIISVEGFVSCKYANGTPLYTRGIFRDITAKLKNEAELKLIHQEIRDSHANLHALLHHAPEAVIVAQTESTILYWNPKATEIFGWSMAEVVGKSLTDFIIPPQHRAAHVAGMKRFLDTGEAHVLNRMIEITALGKSGVEFYVSLTISRTFYKGEDAFIAFIRNIDEEKKNAIELEQKKLQLEQSNQELEQFAHVASHDMKEPIRKIRIFIEKLKLERQAGSSENHERYIDKIENAASRLAIMVDGVLSYSSLKAETISFEKVDLNAIIKDVAHDLELIVEQKRAVIRADDLPAIEGKDFLLYQYFYNLMNNSLKFTRPDVDPLIEIVARNVTEPVWHGHELKAGVPYVEILFRDNGIGFRQEFADLIFKTFSRLHSREQFEGTGLGLSLCKTIIEKHNGFIEALGEPDSGAVFLAVFPKEQASH